MNYLEYQQISCPYCGESLEIQVDYQEAGDQYIEDCQVCCCPITLKASLDEEGAVYVTAHAENDA